MRKWLQDKRVVGGLVALAVATAGWPAVEGWLRSEPETVSARTPDLPELPQSQSTTPLTHPAESTGSWRTRLAGFDPAATARTERDPFAPVQPPEPAFQEPAEHPLILQAISFQKNGLFAVINRTIVAPGDVMGPYLVSDIFRDEVHLKYRTKRIVLRFQRGGSGPQSAQLMERHSAEAPSVAVSHSLTNSNFTPNTNQP